MTLDRISATSAGCGKCSGAPRFLHAGPRRESPVDCLDKEYGAAQQVYAAFIRVSDKLLIYCEYLTA
jgi:hypothetical protein